MKILPLMVNIGFNTKEILNAANHQNFIAFPKKMKQNMPLLKFGLRFVGEFF